MTLYTREINVRINVDDTVLDPTTGLPLLPEGWMWKVEPFNSRGIASYNYQVIAVWHEVTPRRPVLGIKRTDKVLEYRSKGYWDLFRKPEELVESAQNAARYGNRRTPEHSEAADEAVLGYYPPKTAFAETGGNA